MMANVSSLIWISYVRVVCFYYAIVRWLLDGMLVVWPRCIASIKQNVLFTSYFQRWQLIHWHVFTEICTRNFSSVYKDVSALLSTSAVRVGLRRCVKYGELIPYTRTQHALTADELERSLISGRFRIKSYTYGVSLMQWTTGIRNKYNHPNWDSNSRHFIV